MEKWKTLCGFTLVELLFALAILAILVSLSLPALHGLSVRYRMELDMQLYKRYLALARHYAIAHMTQVTICPLIQNHCNKEEWGQSLSVFLDLNGDGTLDADEHIIKTGDPLAKQVSFSYPRPAVTFRADGTPKGLHNGTFRYCAKGINGEFYGQALSISYSGRTKLKDDNNCRD